MARQTKKAKTRRALLAEVRELSTQLAHKKVTVTNLEAQAREAQSKAERAETNAYETVRANGRLERELGIKDGRIMELARELFMTIRSSMRKDGVAFEDIERIIREREQSFNIERRDGFDDFGGAMRERRPGDRRY